MSNSHEDTPRTTAGGSPKIVGAALPRLVAACAIVATVAVAAMAPPQVVLAAAAGPSAPAASVAATDTSGSVTPSVSIDPSGSIPPTGTTPTSSTPKPTPSTVATTAVFARMRGSKLEIHFPAPPKKLVAVGFHQADNKKAVIFAPLLTCHGIGSASKIKALIKKGSIKLFQQPLRGRGDSNLTAADCAVPPKTTVVAPVSGVVTNVRHYLLYGYIDDLRLEIKPDGSPHLRVVMIHITGVKVKKGKRVIGGITPVAVVRHLPLVSTINRFVPVKPVDHVHIQVNLDTFKGSY
jgi:hypothetical protein